MAEFSEETLQFIQILFEFSSLTKKRSRRLKLLRPSSLFHRLGKFEPLKFSLNSMFRRLLEANSVIPAAVVDIRGKIEGRNKIKIKNKTDWIKHKIQFLLRKALTKPFSDIDKIMHAKWN